MKNKHKILRAPVVLLALLLSAIPASSYADTFQSLLMPGPVINSHEKFENDCDLCHDTSNKKRQAKLCISCHDHRNIGTDMDNKSGFHGRLPGSLKDNCKHCHTDHEGRKARIVLLDPTTFDHARTDFLLKGAHKTTPCNACHHKGEKYTQADKRCYACHKKDDVHDGKQGRKCHSCHTESSWKKTDFNHDKTDFPLLGAHKETTCNRCHIDQQYKDTPATCIGCHRVNDVHRGGYGRKCDSCHNNREWKHARFDHDKKTDFPLRGSHRKATCNSCHISGDLKKKVATTCFGCHRNDDSHKGQYGKKCQDCHTERNWSKTLFKHEKTDFPLHGKHTEVGCTQCHRGSLYQDKLKTDCVSCHKKDDIHKGTQGNNCGSCHNEKGWHDNVAFDHDISRFPLIGMHAVTPCEECHLTEQYSDASRDCNHCHRSDDVHKARLGTNCGRCHNPNAWNIWLFDHNKDTDFRLDGAHEKTGCYDCHQTAARKKLQASTDCISCHRSQDIHNRQFGRQCGQCHNTRSFRGAVIKKNSF